MIFLQALMKNVDQLTIKNRKCEKLLGVKCVVKLAFNQHISDLCQKASRKVNALARVTPYMNLLERRLLMNYFFKAQCN